MVCSGNSGSASPFVLEQADQLRAAHCTVDLFLIQGKGVLGYLKNLPAYRRKIRSFQPQIVHAHGGMSALLAGLQRLVPVVVTFHGSDVNVPRLRRFSRLAMRWSIRHIVVSEDMKTTLGDDAVHVIPCAVNADVFQPMNRAACKQKLGWSSNHHYVLFSSAFDRPVKNAALAKQAIQLLQSDAVHLIELKDKSRTEVAILLNACDAALMTSISEGSPQFIKEAMACQTPIVSTRVGDVANLLNHAEGNFLVGYEPKEVAEALNKAIQFRREFNYTDARKTLELRGLFPQRITEELLNVYRASLGSNH